SWPPPWDPSTASRPQPLGAPVCLLAGCALGNCWCSAQAEECKRWQPGKGRRRRRRRRGNRGREGRSGVRKRQPAGGNRPCARAAAVPAPSAPGTPGAPARAGPRISVQSTAALRGGASLGAGAEVESRADRRASDENQRGLVQSGGATRTQLRPWFSAPCQRGAAAGAGIARRSPRPRAARGGGSRTAGSRQTSRTAPGARVQRASSDPRGTTQPARALHNARDADEMVRQNGGVNPSSAPCVVQPPLYGAPRQLSRLDQARRMPRARRLEVVHALHLGPGPGSAMAERASSEVHGAGRRMSPGGDRRGRKREGSTRAPCTGTPFRPRAGSRAGERSLAYAGSW
ncbi:unnamed protein product, partial [Prorocentrum cordatum]